MSAPGEYVLDHPGHEHHGKTVISLREVPEEDISNRKLGRVVRVKGTKETFTTTLWRMARPTLGAAA